LKKKARKNSLNFFSENELNRASFVIRKIFILNREGLIFNSLERLRLTKVDNKRKVVNFKENLTKKV